MTRSTYLRAASAAALTLAAFAASAGGASAAITTQHYQMRVSVTCAGICSTKFPKLAANQALDIDHVACDVNTTGEVADAAISLLPTSLNFSMPFGGLWKRTGLGLNLYTLSGEMNVRVPLGRQFEVYMLAANGTAYGSCSVTGTLLIQS